MTFFIEYNTIIVTYRPVGSQAISEVISMDTREKIKKAAVDNFGKYGYNGASLSKIAEDVGIKKPSLYAHFENKQALFDECMQSAMADFMDYAGELLNTDNKTAKQALYDLPESYVKNNKSSDTDRLFYLRFAYMPPEELGENMVRYSNDFIKSLAVLLDEPIRKLLEESGVSPKRHSIVHEAYLCMFDGLMVELLFGETKGYSKRLDYSWDVFMRGIG